MKIEILGTGCYKCMALEEMITKVLLELGETNVQVARISDESAIVQHMPLEDIPGLIIDGVLASTRQLPERTTLKDWLTKARNLETRSVT